MEYFSRPFDVHKWSDHSEVNKFVDSIYENHFKFQKSDVLKKQLKVVLLDLYIAWLQHPKMKIGINMNNNAYKAKSRYNELHISKKTPEIVRYLNKLRFIYVKNGYFGQGLKEGKITRIWPTKKLIRLFEKAKFKEENIKYHESKEVIILRDENKKNVEYLDTNNTQEMRSLLKEYNYLLSKTFIDIPELDIPNIQLGNKLITISLHEKFIRRIFSNNSWEDNGRFYGGWWQRIPKSWRSKIYINGMPTIEDDYGSLHPILLYAKRGIDYHSLQKGDPYNVAKLYLDNPDDQRKLIKKLFLTAINAKDEKSCFQAVKSELQTKLQNFKFTFDNLREILDALKNLHPEISDDFCNGKGIGLLNLDGQIAEYIIKKFTYSNIPVLCIHDSFIVSFKQDDFLRTTMNNAVKEVIDNANPIIKRKNFGFTEINNFNYLDRNIYLNSLDYMRSNSQVETSGYLYRKQMFKEYLEDSKRKTL